MNDLLNKESFQVSPLGGRRGISLIECPRDAMQGWKNFIPTEQKILDINSFLKIGFCTIHFGNFVSPIIYI